MSVHVDQNRVEQAPAGTRPDVAMPCADGAQVLPFPPPGAGRSRGSRNKTIPQFGSGRNYDSEARATVEWMADATMRLARRNEALEDFAALVAHELKTPLEAALLAADPHAWILSALDLVESLHRAATVPEEDECASLDECLADASVFLHRSNVIVTANEDAQLPLSPASLSVILRNLLLNAAAAKACHVTVFVARRRGRCWLVVDDDGVGLGADEHDYRHGSGIGLELCERIARRNGGRLELIPRHGGGTRAILMVERAA